MLRLPDVATTPATRLRFRPRYTLLICVARIHCRVSFYVTRSFRNVTHVTPFSLFSLPFVVALPHLADLILPLLPTPALPLLRVTYATLLPALRLITTACLRSPFRYRCYYAFVILLPPTADYRVGSFVVPVGFTLPARTALYLPVWSRTPTGSHVVTFVACYSAPFVISPLPIYLRYHLIPLFFHWN